MDQYTKKLVVDLAVNKKKFTADLQESVAATSKAMGTKLGGTIATGLSTALGSSEIGGILAKGISAAFTGKNALVEIFAATLDSLATLLKNSLNELGDMLEASQLSSASTRSTVFGYGMSTEQAYGMSKALSVVGLNSLEDLWYANDQERQQFQEALTRYTTYYSNLAQSGFFKELQDYQYEMNNFNEEMQQIFIKFLVDNKDTIITMMHGLIDVSNWVLNTLSKVIGAPKSESEISANVADVISNYQTSHASVQFYNNFNGVTKDDAQWIANSTELSYEQFIKSLGE